MKQLIKFFKSYDNKDSHESNNDDNSSNGDGDGKKRTNATARENTDRRKLPVLLCSTKMLLAVIMPFSKLKGNATTNGKTASSTNEAITTTRRELTPSTKLNATLATTLRPGPTLLTYHSTTVPTFVP